MANPSLYVPQEILLQILPRLPSKTLCRFLTVCKLWSKLITNISFIFSNLNHNLTTQSNTHLLLRLFDYKSNKEQFLFYPFNNSFEGPLLVMDPPIRVKSKYVSGKSTCYRVIGSCNGLVCLTGSMHRHGSSIILWNPSIRKFVTLPDFSIYRQLGGYRVTRLRGRGGIILRYVFGFGMSLLDNDFKVVRLAYCPLNMWTIFEVFSLKRGKSREINVLSCNYYSTIYPHQAYLNGCCHWVGRRVLSSYVIVFDLNDETCREILLPKRLLLDGETSVAVNLTTISREDEECLAIIWRVKDRRESYRVWLMRDYGALDSWEKLYEIDLAPSSMMQDAWFVQYMKNDGMLMKINGIQLACYYPQDQSIKELDIFDSAPSMFADRYVESLVLLT